MENPINNYHVYNPKLEPVLTDYPKVIKSDDGERLVNVPTKDSDFDVLSSEDFSLHSLLSAGVDPSRMSIHTDAYNAVNDVPRALDSFNSINELYSNDNNFNNVQSDKVTE